jgi:hypothetical protein
VIAAIGNDGRGAVVWGLGATEAEALADAHSNGADWQWDAHGSATVVVSQLTATLIDQGEVDCEALGIDVHCDREGRIIEATVRS